MELFILRHGKTLWNSLGILQGGIDSELLSESIDDTLKLKEKFEKENLSFDIVLTSQSLRTIRTAQLLGYDKPIIMEEFNELGMGKVQGVSYKEFSTLYPIEFHNYFKNPHEYNPCDYSGESYYSLIKRVEAGIERLKQEFCNTNKSSNEKTNIIANKKVLLITHGVTMQGILSYIEKGRVDIDDFARIELPENLELFRGKI